MCMNRFLRVGILAIIAAIFAIPQLAVAQWTQAYDAKTDVYCIFFMDKLGSPNNGLIGETGAIEHTTDIGVTWAKATVPASMTGSVSNFSFSDFNIGWASVLHQGTAAEGLYGTVDGGASWKIVPGAPYECNSVFYNAPNHRLFVASATDSAAWSSDQGTTWHNFGPPGLTGFAFSTGNIGVATAEGGTKFMRTTDGGTTWLTTSMSFDSWQPVGMAGTKIFFCTSHTYNQMYRSSDGGLTWRVIPAYPFLNPPTPVGMVDGDMCSLFAATSLGVYASVADGKTWLTIAGPMEDTATRFYVSSDKVWAIQTVGKINYTTRLVPPLIHLVPGPMTMVGSNCGASDSTIFINTCLCSPMVTLNSATSSNSKFTVTAGPLHRPICGLDSVIVHYTATTGVDSTIIDINFSNGTATIDSQFVVYGAAKPLSVSFDVNKVFVPTGKSCSDFDTFIVISNNSCNDNLTITQLLLQGDNPNFTLGINPPAVIPANSSLRIPIVMHGVKQGSFYATITATVGNKDTMITKVINLTYYITNTAKPDMSLLTIKAVDICHFRTDTAIWIKNTLCDTLIISNIILVDPTNYTVNKPTFPAFVAPGDSIRIPVKILTSSAGVAATKLNIYMSILGVEIDSIITLSTTLTKTLALQADMKPTKPDFSSVNQCNPRDLTVLLTNNLCFPLTIKSVTFKLGDGQITMISAPKDGTIMPSGGIDSVKFHFAPTSSGAHSASMTIVYLRDGKTNSVSFPITGFGVTGATAALSDSTLHYDSIQYCNTKLLYTLIRNEACTDLKIKSITPKNGGNYVVVAPKIGDNVKQGGADTLFIQLLPTASGAVTDSFDVVLTDGTNDTPPVTVGLIGFVHAPIHNVSFPANGLDYGTVKDCENKDLSITLTNNGTCDSLHVPTVTVSGPNTITIVSTTPPPPVVIAPGQSITVKVHVAPNLGDVSESGKLNFGTDTSVSVTANVIPCATAAKLVLSTSDSTFLTQLCTPLTKRYVVRNTGGTPIGIDNATLKNSSGQSKFSLNPVVSSSTTIKGNDSLVLLVTYDPSGTGSDTIEFDVASNGNFSHSAMLSGSAIGNKFTAHLGLDVAGSNATTTLPEKLLPINLVLRDDVYDTLKVTSMHFVVHYNKNVLELIGSVTPAAGWTLGPVTPTQGALDITLNAPAGTTPKGTKVASLTMQSFVSDSDYTFVTVDQVKFNPADPNFEPCHIKALSAGEVVTVTMNYACTDTLIRDMLRGNNLVTIFSAQPNPVTKGGSGQLTTRYELQAPAHVVIDMMDVVGNVVRHVENRDSGKGLFYRDFSVEGLGAGSYFLVLTTGRERHIQRVIVR